MKGWIRGTWTGCVVALALGVPLAHADGGTIRFVGAVVTPTCSFAHDSSGMEASHGACGVTPSSASLPSSQYRQQVVALEEAFSTEERLLGYFAHYAGTEDTRLMTRVYD